MLVLGRVHPFLMILGVRIHPFRPQQAAPAASEVVGRSMHYPDRVQPQSIENAGNVNFFDGQIYMTSASPL